MRRGALRKNACAAFRPTGSAAGCMPRAPSGWRPCIIRNSALWAPPNWRNERSTPAKAFGERSAKQISRVKGENMESQIKLGRIFGVEIGLHYSWLLIALFIAFSLLGYLKWAHPNWDDSVIWSMALFTSVLFFATVIAHELSHAMVAK